MDATTTEAVAPARTKNPTIRTCVRQFCLDCLGAPTARSAFDCQSRVCPLYTCSPFRKVGRRRATKAHVSAYCRHCQPEDHSDCGGPYVLPDGSFAQPQCALFPWRPWQPGGVPKTRTLSEERRAKLRAGGFPGRRQPAA